jgi:hypothetical protein
MDEKVSMPRTNDGSATIPVKSNPSASALPRAFDWRSRRRAALIHLGGSLVVAALAATLVFTLWYPWPYRIVSGGTELFMLLVSIDVVLGPLLTFSVFDRRKPAGSLRRDLAVVVLLQVVALGYGLHTTFVARPVALALEGQRFRAPTAVEVVQSELSEAPKELRTLSLYGPITVRAVIPGEGDEKFDAIQLGLAGIDVGMRPKYWRVWDDAGRREALAGAKPLAPLLDRQSGKRAEVDAAVARTGRPVQAMVYLPLLARRTDWVVLLDARSGEVVGFAPLDGF